MENDSLIWIVGLAAAYLLFSNRAANAAPNVSGSYGGGGDMPASETASGSPSPTYLDSALWGKPSQVSPAGAAFIQSLEGLSLVPYGPANALEIGYGHVIQTGEDFSGGITQEQAQAIFDADLSIAAAAVSRLTMAPLSQGQYDALVSLVFNIGQGNFARSTLLQLVNARDYAGAAAQFGRWNQAGGQIIPGLTARRAQEAQIFAGG
jgi:lysozyme